MTVHSLKCDKKPFGALLDGRKTFEWRREDTRVFRVGDVLHLMEQTRQPYSDRGELTGRYLDVKVTFLLRGPQYGIPDGYVCMAVIKRPRRRRERGRRGRWS